jgi:hypothetical protein
MGTCGQMGRRSISHYLLTLTLVALTCTAMARGADACTDPRFLVKAAVLFLTIANLFDAGGDNRTYISIKILFDARKVYDSVVRANQNHHDHEQESLYLPQEKLERDRLALQTALWLSFLVARL